MRSEVGKRLRNYFDKQMKLQLPGFEKINIVGFTEGCLLYREIVADNLSVFIFLMISPKDDKFTVEIAWGRDKNFPDKDLPSDPFVKTQSHVRFRISDLLDKKIDKWWLLDETFSSILNQGPKDWYKVTQEPIEDAINQIKPQVDDVFSYIKTYVIPYFGNIARENGYEF